MIVNRIHDCDYQHHIDSCIVEILNCPELDIKEVADFPVHMILVSYSIKLEISNAHPCIARFLGKISINRETNSIRRRLHAVVTDCLCVSYSFKEQGRDSWCAS